MQADTESISGESDGEVEDLPWFTFPQQKPLFSRLRLRQRQGNLVLPMTPASREMKVSGESDITPVTAILKDQVPDLEKENSRVGRLLKTPNLSNSKLGKQAQENNSDKLSVPHKFRTPFSIKSTPSLVKRVNKEKTPCSVRKELLPDIQELYIAGKEERVSKNQERVLQDILNCERSNYPKITNEHDKLKLNDSQPKATIYPQKGILKNAPRTPAVREVNQQLGKLGPHKVKPINAERVKSLGSGDGYKTRAGCNANQNTLTVKNIQYTILSKIGRGGSSQVYQVLNNESSELLAVKCVELSGADPVTAEGYLKEIEMLSQLQTSNRVIKLIDHEYRKAEQMLFVVMEKGDTDLSTLLKQIAKTEDISIPMIIYYWTEMLHAVKEIHNHGIVHSDLKPANFLLVCGRLKLIDFGIASAMQNDMTSVEKSSVHGTCNYISPEAVQDPNDASKTKVGYKSDVWSLGCILYNLLYGKTPFQHITNNFVKLKTIANPSHQIQFPPVSEECPLSLFEAMKQCLAFSAKERPTVAQLLSIRYICSSNHCNGFAKPT